MMSAVLRRKVLSGAINLLDRSALRSYSQVINLTQDELRSTDPSNKQPSKYQFERLDFKTSVVSKVMMKVKSKKMREKHQLMMLEGRRLIQEAVDAGCVIDSLFYSRQEDINSLNLPEGPHKIFKTPYSEIKFWSDLSTPPGLIGIFRIPKPIAESRTSMPITIICDQLREPGNLGSMIRNCAGVGVRRVILTPGCTDLWDGKVLRGGAGAHFKIRIHSDVPWEEIEELVSAEDSKLLLATAHAPENRGSTFDILPIHPYYEFDYTGRHNFIVIGGETEGISSEAYAIATKTNGARVTIPLANGVESLNSVAAASIIMFEVRKQVLTAKDEDSVSTPVQ